MPSLFKRPRPSSAPDVVYPSSLATLYQGHAIWYPEPHGTGEPQIGDVGYLSEGAFIRLFSLNPSLKPEQQVTFWHTPFKPAVPLDPGIFEQLDKREALRAGHYPSHGVYRRTLSGAVDVAAGPYASIGMNVEHTCTESQGAVLVIKSPALRESILRREPLHQYVRAHYREWYAYAGTTLGLGVEREEISLVTGWAKTSADWKAVAFTRSSTSYLASLEARAVGVVGAKLHGERTHETEPPEIHREGAFYSRAHTDSSSTPATPKPTSKRRKAKASKRRKQADPSSFDARADSEPEPGAGVHDQGPPAGSSLARKKNQCIFLKRCMMKRRILFNRIVAGAGPHRLPRQEDRRSGQAGEGLMAAQSDNEGDEEGYLSDIETEEKVIDPLSTLLNYMLEVSNAAVAIASDEDLLSIVGDDTPVDFAMYLRRVCPVVEVDDGCAAVSIPDTILKQQARTVVRRAIASTDIYKWPGLSFDGAGSLETGRIFIGPSDADTRPLKWNHSAFQSSSRSSRECEFFAVSPDGKLLSASFQRSTALVWRLSDGLLVQRLQNQGHTGRIQWIAFSPNSHHLVSGSDDKTAIVWDIRSGHVHLRLEGHRDAVQTVAYSPDGSRIATGSDDRSVKIWDSSSGECLHSLDLGGEVYDITFSPDSAQLTIELEDASAICDAHTGARTATLRHDGENMLLSLSLQGDRALIGSDNGTATIWSTVTGKKLLRLNEHTDEINSAAFSPDGAEVMTASNDRTVVTSDSRTGRRRRVYQVSSAVSSVIYSQNGDYVAMGDKAGRVRMYYARSGEFLAEFEGHPAAVEELQFLPDGHSFLSHSEHDRAVRLWSIRDAIRLR